MAKKIRWSFRANQDRFSILQYWKDRNKSNTYSIKLDNLFREGVELIADLRELGKPTDIVGVRIKIIRDNLIYYRVQDKSVDIIYVVG